MLVFQTVFLCLLAVQQITGELNAIKGRKHNQAPPKISTRIVGGDTAKPNEFPYQLALEINEEITCGASLIHPQWAITARHCTFDKETNSEFKPEQITAVGGEHILTDYEHHEQERKVIKIFNHEKYDPAMPSNDIALLKLIKPFEITKYVQTIDLPDASYIPTGNGIVTGWGQLKEGKEEYGSNKLMKVTLPVVSQDACKNAYPSDPITNGQFCAGYLGIGGKDACQGDSGGPFAVSKNKKSILAGITSFGDGCADPKHPGVFTNVAFYRSWIDANMQ